MVAVKYDFRVGDVVQVHGVSGPTMTISKIDEMAGSISCLWFDIELRLNSGVFEPRILEPVTANAGQ